MPPPKAGWLTARTDQQHPANARAHQNAACRTRCRTAALVEGQEAGVEAGLAGALSIIPQILISLIIKMPSFVLAIIRECTLSTVRCVRILTSADTNKFTSIKVILTGAASAIVGVYVSRVISNAIAPIPLLNRFNPQVTSVLSGLMITAVPLIAIYTFEQNKNKLLLFSKSVGQRNSDLAE